MLSTQSKFLVATAAAALVALAFAARVSAENPAPSAAAKLARGKYLVEQVGLCADCHSPRDQTGQYVKDRWLQGAPLAFAPTVPMPVWAPVAPPLAGLPTMTEAHAATFLETGLKPDGSRPRPPMPEFRFNAEDAAAVAAYLKSLAKTE